MSRAPLLVHESPKNRVLVYEDRVEKVFHSGRGSARKARREAAALHALAGVAGVPSLIGLGHERRSVVMSRVLGTPLAECERVSAQTIVSLRRLVEEILARGVARHSLPPRDVLVRPDGSAGLVDFERTTRRRFALEPTWLAARSIMRFQLLRLIGEHAPELLTDAEQWRLRRQLSVRAALQRPLKVRRRVARFLRARLSGVT